jgi:hypothetical protein
MEGPLERSERGPSIPRRVRWWGLSFCGWSSCAAALLETVAVAVHSQDANVMGEPVQQCAGEAFRAVDFGPLLEGQVRGDEGRSALIALAELLEEQLGAGLGQRHEAQFIDDEQLIADDLLLEAEQLLKTKEFNSLTRSLTQPISVSTCDEFTELALGLCNRVDLGPGQLYRLVGVGLSNFLLDEAVADNDVPSNETDGSAWSARHDLYQ